MAWIRLDLELGRCGPAQSTLGSAARCVMVRLKTEIGVRAHKKDDSGGRARETHAERVLNTPAQGQKRAAEWGQAGLQAKIGAAWGAFVARAGDWVDVVEQSGGGAVDEVYKATVAGTVDPRKGMILSF